VVVTLPQSILDQSGLKLGDRVVLNHCQLERFKAVIITHESDEIRRLRSEENDPGKS
jgi:hypothetical protein